MRSGPGHHTTLAQRNKMKMNCKEIEIAVIPMIVIMTKH